MHVPYGHVILNFTEIELAAKSYYSDFITVHDGNTTSAEQLWRFNGAKPAKLPVVFVASTNHFTVRFGAYSNSNPEKLYRFKATYTTRIDGKLDCIYDLCIIYLYITVFHAPSVNLYLFKIFHICLTFLCELSFLASKHAVCVFYK